VSDAHRDGNNRGNENNNGNQHSDVHGNHLPGTKSQYKHKGEGNQTPVHASGCHHRLFWPACFNFSTTRFDGIFKKPYDSNTLNSSIARIWQLEFSNAPDAGRSEVEWGENRFIVSRLLLSPWFCWLHRQ
jgi:hypothetical protein